MKNKDLVSIKHLGADEVQQIFDTTSDIKNKMRKGIYEYPLKNKTLGMIFQKPSTRTRVSFEAGMFQLGGHALFLNSADLQLKRGETVADTARTLSRYVDGIMIRTFAHSDVVELAKHASVPVINGLTDLFHPCQILSDAFTILEKRGTLKGIKVVWIGDGNNVCHSWINLCPLAGMDLAIVNPKGYSPDKEVLEHGMAMARKYNTKIEFIDKPREAVKNADVIYTDIWVSMGQEKEVAERMSAFKDYQINRDLLQAAPSDVMVMHCLPAHRGEEITDEIIDGPNSIVFDEAENRLHTQKGIMVLLMSGK